MAHDRQTSGKCPHCQTGDVVCSYNHFEREALTIDAWEHKCPNCGVRETKAFRSDEPPAAGQAVDPTICPYCQRRPVAS
jgi:ssDNA-binding Zn-finger/Zn-ribbon topoisomerase 1